MKIMGLKSQIYEIKSQCKIIALIIKSKVRIASEKVKIILKVKTANESKSKG